MTQMIETHRDQLTISNDPARLDIDAILDFFTRAYHRILKLTGTIADLAGSEEIQSVHLAEALQYRPKIMIG